jgi:hypothetical protein
MMEGPGADSEEKRALASDLDTVMVDSLKALDLSRPIREADMLIALKHRTRPMLQMGQKVLAEAAPSTHDPKRT